MAGGLYLAAPRSSCVRIPLGPLGRRPSDDLAFASFSDPHADDGAADAAQLVATACPRAGRDAHGDEPPPIRCGRQARLRQHRGAR